MENEEKTMLVFVNETDMLNHSAVVIYMFKQWWGISLLEIKSIQVLKDGGAI